MSDVIDCLHVLVARRKRIWCSGFGARHIRGFPGADKLGQVVGQGSCRASHSPTKTWAVSERETQARLLEHRDQRSYD